MGDRLADKIKTLHDVSEIDVIVPVSSVPSLSPFLPPFFYSTRNASPHELS